VDVSAWGRRAREHARLLTTTLDASSPHFREALAHDGARQAIGDILNINVLTAEAAPEGCSVAGSCDRATRTITVVTAAVARMRFTVLHELAHLLGDDHGEFQDALYAVGPTKRAVEEDACEAFAASMLLSDGVVDPALEDHGRTARGLMQLESVTDASREACAVAVAQRLTAPGYVALVKDDGTLSFAARSGDVLPIARGSDQRGSVVDAVLKGQPSLRDRGSLRFRGGTLADEMYVDVVRDGALVYIVATVDSPDWDVLHQLDTSDLSARLIDCWCEECGTEFKSPSRCEVCGEPLHDVCGRCSCEVRPLRGERTCSECFQRKPGRCFPTDKPICEDHLP